MSFIEHIDQKVPAYCLAKVSLDTMIRRPAVVRVLKIYHVSARDKWQWRSVVVRNAETPLSLAKMANELDVSFGERKSFDEIGGSFNSWEEAEIALGLAGWRMAEDVSSFFAKDKIWLPLSTVEKAWMLERVE